MEVKVFIRNIENLKTSTSVKEEKDKDGDVVDRRLVTKIQFECEIEPTPLSNVHHLIAGDHPVHAIIGSPQAIMEIRDREGALAEVS